MKTPARVAVLLWAAAFGAFSSCSSEDPGVKKTPSEPAPDAAPDAPAEIAAVTPVLGAITEVPLDCSGAYALPAAFTGPKGLGGVGWTLADLTNDIAWNVPNEMTNLWIAGTDMAHAGVRLSPHLAPEAGHCYKDMVQAAVDKGAGAGALSAVLAAMSGFGQRDRAYDDLITLAYEPHAYDFGAGDPLVGALRGLYEKPNTLPGAPVVPPWDDVIAKSVTAAVEPYPDAVKLTLAKLVLSVGEAYDLKVIALSKADPAKIADLHHRFVDEKYYPFNILTRALMAPALSTDLAAILEASDAVDVSRFYIAAEAVAAAADDLYKALSTQPPIEAPPLDLLTPHGRVFVTTSASGDEHDADKLEDAAVFVDLAGDDLYHGRFASTSKLWLSASALIDVSGNDAYSPELPDIEEGTWSASAVLARESAFTAGSGLLGVGLLLDGAGDDVYRASAYSLGSSAFGVGVLADYGGKDSYKIGILGEGVGYFGAGLLFDAGGDDHYGAYMAGEGVGRPGGVGLLLDAGGDDEYIAYYNDDPPELPSPGYKSYYALPSGYDDELGEHHHLSFCQGVGMGYRFDWFGDQKANWMGGFGALLDLGAGKDVHYSDTLSQGQGFVYGFGLLYDGGGDDLYRSFWWAYGSGTHMGTGLMIEEGGDDNYFATRASATLGHDTGASWFLEKGGKDTYGGRLNFGLSLTNGLAFFLDLGGDDLYALPPDAAANPDHHGFGFVDDPVNFANRAGIFMDLGGGNDTYQTARPEVKNGASWVLPPSGAGADPAKHKGIGLDE